jgi:hypothetical protein
MIFAFSFLLFEFQAARHPGLTGVSKAEARAIAKWRMETVDWVREN